MNIVKNHIPIGSIKMNAKPYLVVRRPGTKITPTIIVIHSTANPTSTAIGERNWLLNLTNDRSASWNLAVDQNEVVEAIPCGEVSYGILGTYPNHDCISVEICESGDRKKTLANAAELVAYLMGEWNIPITKVMKHRNFQQKTCPQILSDGPLWNGFIESIKASNVSISVAMNIINQELMQKELAPLDVKYWIGNAASGKTCNGEYVKALILRIAKALQS